MRKLKSEFKETYIRTPKPYRMPNLELNGKWMDTLGFTPGTLVYLTFKDACLNITTDANTKCGTSVLCVKSKMVRGKPRTILTLEWFLLKRYGFGVGDRIGLMLEPGRIQITKINNFTTEEVV